MMNRREQRAFTLAFVWLALKSNLTTSERRTLETFERVWFAGKDFTKDRAFHYFTTLCKMHHVPVRFMKKPSDTGRRGEKGAMIEVDWTDPEPNGSYWPAMKNGKGERRTTEELIAMKKQYRTEVMLKEMARLAVSELTYKYDFDARVERVVDERLAEREPERIQPEPQRIDNPSERLTYDRAYSIPTSPTVH
jgi:hypothetical protein